MIRNPFFTVRFFLAILILPSALTITANLTMPGHCINSSWAAQPYKNSPAAHKLLLAGSQDAVHHYTVEGTAGLIEKDGTVIVHTEGKTSQIVYIDDDTKIIRNGKPAVLGDLKPGDRVKAVVGAMRKALEFSAAGP